MGFLLYLVNLAASNGQSLDLDYEKYREFPRSTS